MKIYGGKLVGGSGDSFKFLSREIIPREQSFFYFEGLEKAHMQKQWLHIMEEILPITQFLLDCFGIQYVADFVKKCMTCQKKGSLTLKTKTGAAQYTSLNCCEESNWRQYP